MKYYKFLLSCLIGGSVLLATGCNDDDDMPGGQFQLTQSGRIDLTVDYQKADTVVPLTVLNRSMETNSVQLVNFTQTELDAYNQRWNTHFLMIPEDAYQLTQTSVSFTRGEAQKSVEVTFYPSVLYSHLMSQVNTAYSYCLPLKMQNGATDQEIVYAVTLTYPEMRLRDTELSVKMDYLTKDVTVSASIFAYLGTEQPNGEQVEFTLAMPDDKEAWLARYNVANNTDYTLLPEAYMSVGNLKGEADAAICNGTVTVSREPEGQDVLAKGQYVIPLVPRKLNQADDFMLRYDTLAILIDNPLHWSIVSGDKISQAERDTWRIVFCNSDMGPWDSDGIITNILDGRQDTFWACWYQWWDGQDSWWNDNGRGSDWCDYDMQFIDWRVTQRPDIFTETGSDSRWRLADDYIYIAGNREHAKFVIDLGKEYYISEVGICHRSTVQYAHTKTADIYVSNDPEFKFTPMREGGSPLGYEEVNENNWTHICTINTNKDTNEYWAAADINDARSTGASKGRFLKYVNVDVFPEDNGNQQHGGIAEIWIKVVAEIDGKPVEQ